MALTFAQARTILQSRIADSSDSTADEQALNHAQREVARAYRWPELIKRAFLNTVPLYSTGTVAITTNTKDVALTGGTFPTTATEMRFALGRSDPWYGVTTRTDGTNLVLTDNFIDDTVTESSFVIYQSNYALASDVDRVEEMWIHDQGRMIQMQYAATDQQLSEFLHYPSGPGVPWAYYNYERDSSGEKQVLVGPNTPDDVYRIEYTYKKELTDGTLGLDDSRWPVVLSLATAIRYEPEFYERSIVERRRYEKLLAQEIAREAESEEAHVRVCQTRVDSPSLYGYDGWLDNIAGFGRVADPS